MMQRSQSPQQSEFIDWWYGKFHYDFSRNFAIDDRDAAYFLSCPDIAIIARACNDRLEEKKDYKFVYNGRRIRMTIHGFLKLCEAMSTEHANQAKSWLIEMISMYKQHLDDVLMNSYNTGEP